MKILVTGASGFVGRNLREQFGSGDCAGKYEISAPSHVELDLTDGESVDAYFKNRSFDAVVHCAVKPGHRNAKDLSGLYFANTRMFFNLLKNERSFGKMIWLGSGLVYDARHYEPLIGEDFFGGHIPQDEGGFAKYVCARFTETDRKVIELRPFGVYGKYEDYAIRFISNAVCKTLAGLPVTIKQNRRFDYIHVADLIRVIDFFLCNEAKSSAYNVTSARPVELLEIARKIVELGGRKNEILISLDGMGAEYSGSNARLKAEMPVYSVTPLEEGIRGLFDFYSANLSGLDMDALKTDR